ncbi:hypothetical protein GVAV_000324 [Gurleya vavrai]
MDRYNGNVLRFTLINKKFNGVLQGLTEDQSQMVVLVDDQIIYISVLDIIDIKIVPSEKLSLKQINDFDKTINEYKRSLTMAKPLKEEDSDQEFYRKTPPVIDTSYKKKDNTFYYSHEDSSKNKIKESEISESSKYLLNASYIIDDDKIENSIKKSDKQKEFERQIREMKIVKKKEKYINLKDFAQFLFECETIYGPTEQSFLTNVCNNLLDFFIKKNKETFCFILEGNNVYTRLGFFLARKFIENEINFDILYTNKIEDLKTTKERLFYVNNGGKFIESVRKAYDNFITSVSKAIDLSKYCTNDVYCLLINNYVNGNKIAFNYGIPLHESQIFDGKVFLVDAGFGRKVYDVFNYENNCDEKIKRIYKD